MRRMIAGWLRGVRSGGQDTGDARAARARHVTRSLLIQPLRQITGLLVVVLAVQALFNVPSLWSCTTPSTARFRVLGCILFGNFVFFGLRCTSGMRQQGEADLYLNGEDAH
jgi:hypothetical protein